MTDFLLVHSAGQGAWIWGKVWGRMTAPVEHPPRLQAIRQAGRVCTLDLPGHGADAAGDTAQVRMEECVQASVRTAERDGLKDLVLVGHGFAASLILQAARALSTPPKRLVMISGIVPAEQGSLVAGLPLRFKAGYRMLAVLSRLSRQELRLPKPVIRSYLCNGMGPMELVEVLGFFGALPTGVLTSKAPPEEEPLPCPVTYVQLARDRFLPIGAQQRMAQRLPEAEVLTVDSCHQAMLQHPQEVAKVLRRYA